MPTGIGSRKVLTPRSSKNPRRSLPPQAKLIEAASFESFDEQPSSPDIMTTKLMEKVKNNEKNRGTASNSKGSSFNQRLTAAAVTTKTSSNSLAANAGRSKLSTEEFNLGDEDRESSYLNDKYKKNSSSSGGNGYITTSVNDNRSNSYNTNKNNSYNSSNNNISNNASNNTSNSSTNNAINNATNNASNNSYNSSSNNSYSNSNNSYTSSKPNSYNNYNSTINSNNLNSSRSGGYSKPPMIYSDNVNNSFDRWNNSNNSISSSLGGGESVELLQEQVNHLRREYEGLKQRFSDLSRLRLSEPEEMFEEHKKLSELRDQAAERTIKTLQKENEQLKKQLMAKNNEKIIESKESQESQESEEEEEEEIQESENDFMQQVEKILKIYSSFSGLKITPSPSNPLIQWHCEFSSRSGRFDFQLIYESDLNRYQYIPLENGNDAEGTGAEVRIKNLPQFLASDILITADQMQIFFWRLLDTLSKKQQQQ